MCKMFDMTQDSMLCTYAVSACACSYDSTTDTHDYMSKSSVGIPSLIAS